MGHEEEAIAKAQAAAAKTKGADGLHEHHKSTVSYLNERIVTFLMVMAVIGLTILWMVVESQLVLYGSLIAVILLVVLWGVIRLQQIKKVRLERQQQAKSWNSKS